MKFYGFKAPYIDVIAGAHMKRDIEDRRCENQQKQMKTASVYPKRLPLSTKSEQQGRNRIASSPTPKLPDKEFTLLRVSLYSVSGVRIH